MSTLWNGAVTVNEERLSGWKWHLTAQMDAIRTAISQWPESVWGGRSFLFPQLTFSSCATCRGWCYPLSRVCLCGHVIWCKLERQTAKWVQRWCYGAVVAGNTASIPVMQRCCTCVTPIPRLMRDSVKLNWVPTLIFNVTECRFPRKHSTPQQWMDVVFAKEVFGLSVFGVSANTTITVNCLREPLQICARGTVHESFFLEAQDKKTNK